MPVIYDMGYWNILPLEILKHFEPKIYKDFELYQVFLCITFMLNWLKYFDQKSDNFYPKMFQYPQFFIRYLFWKETKKILSLSSLSQEKRFTIWQNMKFYYTFSVSLVVKVSLFFTTIIDTGFNNSCYYSCLG